MSHTISTDAAGTPTFACTAPVDAYCHTWAECTDEGGGCASADEKCTHEKVKHDHCILSEWWTHPDDIVAMHIEQEAPPSNVVAAEINVEWDECPLWSFITDHADGGL